MKCRPMKCCCTSATDGLPKQQSAYRRWHSTETALLKIYNDFLQAADRGEVSALCMLDLSAAFDTVDHELLLKRLELRFGFVGNVLKWIESYLTNRTFTVMHHTQESSEVELECSVPQGSVLGPLLFILYTAELVDIAARWNISLHSYADDTQALLHCKPDAVSSEVVLPEVQAASGVVRDRQCRTLPRHLAYIVQTLRLDQQPVGNHY